MLFLYTGFGKPVAATEKCSQCDFITELPCCFCYNYHKESREKTIKTLGIKALTGRKNEEHDRTIAVWTRESALDGYQ